MAQLDPDRHRRECPESTFTAVGTIVRYMVGVDPRASEALIETVPSLTGAVSCVRVEHLPVIEKTLSRFTARAGGDIFRKGIGTCSVMASRVSS